MRKTASECVDQLELTVEAIDGGYDLRRAVPNTPMNAGIVAVRSIIETEVSQAMLFYKP